MKKTDLLPNPTVSLRAQQPHILLAMLIYGEARGEQVEGKTAVAWTVKNRVLKPRWWGKTWRGVMLKRQQFSCFNSGDPNLSKLMNPLDYDSPIVWMQCYTASVGVYADLLPDPTHGATHYYNLDIPPYWADTMVKTVMIGRHEFLREE